MTRVVDDLHRSTGLRIEVITSTAGAHHPGARAPVPDRDPPDALDAGGDVDVIAEQEPIDRRPPTAGAWTAPTRSSASSCAWPSTAAPPTSTWRRSSSRLRVRFRIDGLLQHFNLGDLGRGPRSPAARGAVADQDPGQPRHCRAPAAAGRQLPGRACTVGPRSWPWTSGSRSFPATTARTPSSGSSTRAARPSRSRRWGWRRPSRERLQPLIRSSAGILLVTGPTGSGKSTTLFGMLKSVYRPEIKVVTAEDPIEYVCNDFSQHEVDGASGTRSPSTCARSCATTPRSS